ncbi:MAG: TonB-dependent receptor [Bacteroidales bacterium]|nr:TonB-dependent receptor [Bacteroidales bacterium]
MRKYCIVKRLLLIIILILLIIPLFSQNNIKGNIIEMNSNEAIEYATIFLIDKNDSIIQGTISDSKGNFILKYVTHGIYHIKASHLCFYSYSDSIKINENEGTTKLKILLEPNNTVFDEIVVKGDRGNSKNLLNKTVIFPDSLDINSAIDAKDVLKKIPSIIIDDFTNKISLLGEKNTLILINDVTTKGRIDLESIKPEDIDKIEIINNPMSKYDGEYTAVINIKLKKNQKQGIIAYNSVSIFNNYQYEYLSLQYGLEKIRFFGSYYYNRRISTFNIFEKRESLYDNSFLFESKSQFDPFKKTSNAIKYGVDYFINDNNILNFTAKFEMYDYLEDKSVLAFSNSSNKDILYNLTGNYIGKEKLGNYSVFYKRKFKKENQNLLVDINYYIFNSNDAYNVINKLENISDNSVSNNDLLQKEADVKQSLNVRVDYTQPVSDKFSLDLGYNYYNRGLDNKFTSNSSNTNFVYIEDRSGIYIDGYFDPDKISISVGSRVEYSSIILNDTTNNSVFNFLPSVGIYKKINDNSTIQMSYDKSLSRPNIWLLNPFVAHDDSLFFSSGNPYLKPSINDYADISYSFKKKSFILSTNLYLDYTKDLIDIVSYIDNNNITYETYDNLTKNVAYGIKLNISRKFFKIFKLSSFINVFNDKYDYEKTVSEGFTYNFNISGNIEFPKKIIAGFYFNSNGKSYSLQGYSLRTPNFNQIYVGKKILKDKANIYLICFTPLQDKRDSYITNANYIQEQSLIINSFLYGFLFKYNFSRGKISKKINRELNMEQDNKN